MMRPSATPACPRFRCVLHPSRPIETADEYRACVRTWAGRGVAPESYQMTRLWYRPITSGLMPPVVIRTTGARIDVDDALRLHPPPPPRPPPIARTDDELAAWPLELRVQQAWDALDARRPAGAYAASCVCHDHGLPLHVAEEVVVANGRRCGWTDLDADAIAGRAANAYQYARDPFGCALTPTSTSHPDLRLRIARLMDLA